MYPLGFHCGMFRERIPTRARLLPLFSQADGYSAMKRISFEDSGNVLSLEGFAVDIVHGTTPKTSEDRDKLKQTCSNVLSLLSAEHISKHVAVLGRTLIAGPNSRHEPATEEDCLDY